MIAIKEEEKEEEKKWRRKAKKEGNFRNGESKQERIGKWYCWKFEQDLSLGDGKIRVITLGNKMKEGLRYKDKH